ncbi:hypothetical protein E6O75_ATG09694 [Venturia nashicola]|uniref:Uncharacterized protein n=1 Tax=Venturia nashicola TaxID=86259 RepID=A0A4Z1P776_9PEZI|nr:hypothetical protein E6O75_ATG09694 [Venturia nashicola]
MEALTKHLAAGGSQAPAAELEPQALQAPDPLQVVTFADDNKGLVKEAKLPTIGDLVAQPLHRSVTYVPSQIGAPSDSAITYTSNPLSLLWYDIKLFICKLPIAPGVIFPWRFGKDADPYDELYPSIENLSSVVLHAFLMWSQTIFFLSLPVCLFLPVFSVGVWMTCMLIFTRIVRYLLNGRKLKVRSSVEVDRDGKFSDEYWIFLNGVAVGQYWLQSNVDRLALTFGRPIQRNFAYNTADIREAYACIKEALQDSRIKKVVFIVHSQGGIEGGLILDWLFAELSRSVLEHLEVYTFANAANHFNNPDWSSPTSKDESPESIDKKPPSKNKVIKHIEHYANVGDFVAQLGVLNYTRVPNRFMGRLFLSPSSGHLFNQHYLHYMFPLDETRRRVADENAFMDMDVRLNRYDAGREDIADATTIATAGEDDNSIAFVGDVNKPVAPIVRLKATGKAERLRVRDFSRLWQYRNGGTPFAL